MAQQVDKPPSRRGTATTGRRATSSPAAKRGTTATKSATAGRPPRRKRKATATGGAGSARSGRSTTPPRRDSGLKRAAAQGLEGRRHDAIGLLLILLALLTALGIVADLTGPFGRAVRDSVGSLVGVFRFLIPVVLAWAAVLLLRRSEIDPGFRIAFGLTFASAGFVALAHLAGGPDGVNAPVAGLRDGGGVFGAVLAEPVKLVLATPGAWLVFGVLLLFGLLVTFDLPLPRAIGLAAAGLKKIGLGAMWLTDRMMTLGEGPLPDRRRRSRTPVPPEPDAARPTIATAPGPAGRAGAPGRGPSRAGGPGPPSSSRSTSSPGLVRGTWKLPPPTALARSGVQQVDERAVQAGAHTLERALGSHGVDTRVVGMTVGPTVSRYELELGPGVKVARVTTLHRDIAYAMAAADVRILAPIPGRQAIGVEVPNQDRHVVTLGDILTSQEAERADHPLEVAIGQDIAGRSVLINLAKLPHLLIAGATGSGKSSCINSLLTSLLMRSTPDQVRLILVDPKRVELTQYDRLPHLLTGVVTDPKKAANALSWAVKEMERRYQLLAHCGFRDIIGYNAAFDEGRLAAEPGSPEVYERLPYIVVVVDELNDLMMVAARDVEESIVRLAQMARAVGLHLVIATQRPSVNVITGVIKANVPARFAFAVSSLADSRVILDQPGAERLVGQGDMLMVTASSNVAQRLQGCWVDETEIRSVVAAWRRQAPETRYIEDVQGSGDLVLPGMPGGSTGDESDDDLLWQAMQIVVESQLGSTSMLQRRLKVGFARAGRLMDLLEQRGVVGPSLGSKARDVLMTHEELQALTATPM